MNYVDGLTAVSCPPSFVARKDNEVLIYRCGFYVEFFFLYIKWMLRKKGISISNGINWTKGNLNCMGFFFCMLQRRWFFLLNWLGLNWNDCVYRFLHFHVSICCKFRLQFNYLLNLFLYCFRGLIKMEFWKKV